MPLLVCCSYLFGTNDVGADGNIFSERANAPPHNARNIVGVALFAARQVKFLLQSIRNQHDIFSKDVKELAPISWWILEYGGLGNTPCVSSAGDIRSPYAAIFVRGSVFHGVKIAAHYMVDSHGHSTVVVVLSVSRCFFW